MLCSLNRTVNCSDNPVDPCKEDVYFDSRTATHLPSHIFRSFFSVFSGKYCDSVSTGHGSTVVVNLTKIITRFMISRQSGSFQALLPFGYCWRCPLFVYSSVSFL
jgi:hypothetical protein